MEKVKITTLLFITLGCFSCGEPNTNGATQETGANIDTANNPTSPQPSSSKKGPLLTAEQKREIVDKADRNLQDAQRRLDEAKEKREEARRNVQKVERDSLIVMITSLCKLVDVDVPEEMLKAKQTDELSKMSRGLSLNDKVQMKKNCLEYAKNDENN